ncbi:hypothetical protein FS842_000573 [Serendipita sp. 407]|nr:hypothetical protein FS842_000573 [Serendipita sp. 407]
MRQPTAPNQPGTAPFHRSLPIPTEPAHYEFAPQLRTHLSDGAAPPPVPARPLPPSTIQRPYTAQGISHSHPEPSTFPVVPPPPPLPRRVLPNEPIHGHNNHPDHALSGSMSHMDFNATIHQPRRLDSPGHDYTREELERREMENSIRLQREEIARQTLALERLRLEEEQKRLEREREELARQAEIAREEEEEKRRREQELREKWEQEQRIREAQWEEERLRREEELERMRIQGLEQQRRLEREMEDARIAAEMLIQEEIEAKKRKLEAAERERAADEAAKAAIAQLERKEKEEKEARRLQEEKDAEMARQWESEDQTAGSSANPVESHGPSSISKGVVADLPEYDDSIHHHQQQQQQQQQQHQQQQFQLHQQHQPHQQVQHNAPANPILPPSSIQDQTFAAPVPHTVNHSSVPMQRPHANTMHALSPPLPHSVSHPQPLSAPPVNPNHFLGPQMAQPLGLSPNRQSMLLPEMSAHHFVHPPNLPNVNSGAGPPFRNHFFPLTEAEKPSVPAASAAGPSSRPNPRPGKLVRPSSLGGGNPNRLSKAPNHNTQFQGSQSGHIASSASMSSFQPPANIAANGRPQNQSSTSQQPSSSAGSSPGAGPSIQPLSSTPSSAPPSLAISSPLGVNFPSNDSISGILHGYGRPVIREQPLPTATPVQEAVIIEPEPSLPFFIVAHTWRHLIRYIASQSNSRVEPSPAALAREKHGPPNLRVVLHFVKLPNGDHRIILYFAVQSIVPPPENYPITDTSVVPYLFPAPEPGRPLENLPETQIYSIPTKPLPLLPLSLPHLSSYLQASLEESIRSRDSRSRLNKLVQATMVTPAPSMNTIMAALTGAPTAPRHDQEGHSSPVKVEPSGSSKRNFIAKMFRPKSSSSQGKGLNNETFDVVTPFQMDGYA